MNYNKSSEEDYLRIKDEPEWQNNDAPDVEDTTNNHTGDENILHIDFKLKLGNSILTAQSDSGDWESKNFEEEDIWEGIPLRQRLNDKVGNSEVLCKSEVASVVKQEVDDNYEHVDISSHGHHVMSGEGHLKGVALKQEDYKSPLNEKDCGKRAFNSASCKHEASDGNGDYINGVVALKDENDTLMRQEMPPSLPDASISHTSTERRTGKWENVGGGFSLLIQPGIGNMYANNLLRTSPQHFDTKNPAQPRKLQKWSSASDCGSLPKLKTHQRSDSIKHKCDFCKYFAPSPSALVRHRRVHTGEKPYQCDKCPYAAAQASLLVIHQCKHTGERPNQCDNSPCAATKAGHLVKHKRIHTDEKPYQCDKCPYATTRVNNLVMHKRIHTDEKPYQCDKCPYAATTAGNLVTHRRTHTDEKPYQCDKCPYAAKQSGALVRHKRKHTGEKPFLCDECPYAAVRAVQLVIHKRKHTGKKPYQCDKCPYAAGDAANLVRHKRIHTDEKPYQCDKCPYAATWASDLVRHERKHTSEKPYQ